MNVLDLFSGIGGFSLGLERAGMKTVAFCEIDPYAQKVLKKHWPDVPIYCDVRELTYARLCSDGIDRIDLICGGFPCQDISVAGKQAGITGQRSGLWSEIARLISEIRPQYAILENVPNLLTGERGAWFGRVLGDLAEIRYDAEWHCIPASLIGATHRRDRVWVVAYSKQRMFKSIRLSDQINVGKLGNQWSSITNSSLFGINRAECKTNRYSLRNDDGFPVAVDRIGCLGNAVVPQIPEMIGRAIIQCES